MALTPFDQLSQEQRWMVARLQLLWPNGNVDHGGLAVVCGRAGIVLRHYCCPQSLRRLHLRWQRCDYAGIQSEMQVLEIKAEESVIIRQYNVNTR